MSCLAKRCFQRKRSNWTRYEMTRDRMSTKWLDIVRDPIDLL